MNKTELVDRVQELTGLQSHESAERVTDAILATFCQRISRGEVADVSHTLETIQASCSLDRSDQAQWMGDLSEFLDRVTTKTNMLSTTAETISRAVFHALKEQIPDFEAQDIAAQLPKELKIVWLEA